MTPEEAPALWRFVPLDEHSVPTAAAADRVRGGLGRLWDRLIGPRSEEDAAEHAKPQPPPRSVLDEAAPAPDWGGASEALDAALGPWADGGSSGDDNVRIVVGPSGNAADDVVRTWARSRRWQIIEPPGIEEILAGGEDWLAAIPRDETPRVLERLDRAYLRHHNGLDLVQRFIERLSSGKERFVVGCGSWSWAYLSRALDIDAVLGLPLALQALDHNRLREWFGVLAAHRFDFCRQVGDRRVLIAGDGLPERETQSDGSEGDSGLLNRLAAFSRGIPLVAWAAWRDSLRLGGGAAPAPARDRATLWVPDWSTLKLPQPPTETLGPCALAVLQEALLQGATTVELLAHILPFPTAEIVNSLQQLRQAALLESGSHGWRVARLGYPAARESLHEAGYLTGRI